MKPFVYTLIGIFATLGTLAQSTADESKGKVTILQDPRLEQLIQKHIEINENKTTIRGYRIQIASSASRYAALDMKASFMKKYPEAKVYLSYQQPYYKLRIGDYRTRLEAQKGRQIILHDFKDAFIVRDDIRIND